MKASFSIAQLGELAEMAIERFGGVDREEPKFWEQVDAVKRDFIRFASAKDAVEGDALYDSPSGVKRDAEKARWDLVPMGALAAVVRVLTFGAAKYGDENWRTVEDSRRRYYAAAMRHVAAWWAGEARDSESGEHHLAHAMCCLLFVLELEGASAGE
jgi:hypothetical protein